MEDNDSVIKGLLAYKAKSIAGNNKLSADVQHEFSKLQLNIKEKFSEVYKRINQALE